jgi:hypothetical protein
MITGSDGYERGVDLIAYRRPRIVDTTCGLSASPGPTAEELARGGAFVRGN